MLGKTIGYIGVICIGIGFIVMAFSNALNSEYASILQAGLCTVFIIIGIIKIVIEYKKK